MTMDYTVDSGKIFNNQGDQIGRVEDDGRKTWFVTAEESVSGRIRFSSGESMSSMYGVSPFDYGAIGDGVSDDSSAFLAACASAEWRCVTIDGDFSLGGNTLTVPPNTIITGSTLRNGDLVLSGNCFVFGVGFDNVSLRPSGDGVRITNCTLQNISRPIVGAIIVTSACNDLEIKDNTISNIIGVGTDSLYWAGVNVALSSGVMKNLKISGNHIHDYFGPAGIYIGGSNYSIVDFEITNNRIHDSRNFGIEFYTSNVSATGVVEENKISNIGSIRPTIAAAGNGCGGIYTNTPLPAVFVRRNNIKSVLEVGIEGGYGECCYNYIEDSGNDQLAFPVSDNSGIYYGGDNVHDNTIVNPGNAGGINFFFDGAVTNRRLLNNRIKNNYVSWSASALFNAGDVVRSGANVYKAKTSGTSGVTPISGTGANIADGSVTWDFKRVVCEVGININATGGVSESSVCGNDVSAMASTLTMSGIAGAFSFHNNVHSYSGAKVEIGGYGSRCAKGFEFSTPAISGNSVVNGDFSQFSSATPDNWTLSNGTITKVASSKGARDVPKILQTDINNRGRISQVVPIKGATQFLDMLIRTNDGIRVAILDGKTSAYIDEFSYSDTSGLPIKLGALFSGLTTDALKFEISTKTQAAAASGLYVTIDYFSCRGSD
jgi:hypothetical protein